MRVLVVEDEKRLAENVANALRQCAGYAVDIADDGESGLFMAEISEYDLVILDLMLPKLLCNGGEGGFEAAKPLSGVDGPKLRGQAEGEAMPLSSQHLHDLRN